MAVVSRKVKTPSKWADFWYYEIGVNVIPRNGKTPIMSYKEYRNKPIPKELFERWKAENKFDKGMCFIVGKVFNNWAKKGLYLNFVDLDNQKAIDEFCKWKGKKLTLGEMGKSMIIELHSDDKTHAHVYFYSTKPLKRKGPDATLIEDIKKNEIPAIEIKGEGDIAFCAGGLHENGYPYEIIGTKEPLVLDEMHEHLKTICNNYQTPFCDAERINGNGNGKGRIKNLFASGEKIKNGSCNNELFHLFRNIIAQNHELLPEEQIRKLCYDCNQDRCEEPLPDAEVETIFKSAQNYIPRQNQNENQDKDSNKKPFPIPFPELEGSKYYRINVKPQRFIIAHNQRKQLIEAVARSKPKDSINSSIVVTQEDLFYLSDTKTFLACIPTRIIRHINPLAFLDLPEKYSISFEDYAEDRFTLSHMTLSEIISGLRERGFVLGDGVDMALNAIVQAYKQDNQIVDNEDMDYIGFLKGKDNRIIASKIEIKDPVISDLEDALLFIEQLKPYFEKRLDLLSTSIVWGMIAPAVFMLKTNNYFLKWLHFYGSANATKSNTGKIVLALDGHHEDLDFLLKITNIDSTARLGDAVSHSTFPKLVDEVDLTGKDKEWLVNQLKSVIESQIARSKFPSNRALGATKILALTPLMFTSNPPPPTHDSGYMRRVIDRHFPKSETWKENHPVAIQFKEFLRMNMKRLKPLGDFRNWYIMNNQEEILDETRPQPLDLGYKILTEVYRLAAKDKEIPEWLSLRLSENQLEEAFEDNGVIVKRAFEKYIDEQLNKSLAIWKNESESGHVNLPKEVSERLWKLAESNLLPDVKLIRKNYQAIISKGILTEIYNHGVTKDQCPNLRALADYMNATYRKSDGKSVIAADKASLSCYFDEVDAGTN